MSTQPTEQHTPTPQPEPAKKKERPRVFHYQLPGRGDGLIHTLCGVTFPIRRAIYRHEATNTSNDTGEQRPSVQCAPCDAMALLDRQLRM